MALNMQHFLKAVNWVGGGGGGSCIFYNIKAILQNKLPKKKKISFGPFQPYKLKEPTEKTNNIQCTLEYIYLFQAKTDSQLCSVYLFLCVVSDDFTQTPDAANIHE